MPAAPIPLPAPRYRQPDAANPGVSLVDSHTPFTRNTPRGMGLYVLPATAGGNEEIAVATVALTKDNFEDTINSNEVVLVDFWASWCGPCRVFSPIFEAASERHGDVVFAKVDTEAEFELAAGFQIMSIPTLMAFRDQILIYSQPGALPASALEELITKIKDLDMDEVRHDVEEHARAAS